MGHHFNLFILLSLLSLNVWAQDERYYRQILSGELPKSSVDVKEDPIQHLSLMGSRYLVDLNGDGNDEILQPQKRDGVDFLEIRDASERKIFEAKLFVMGAESHLFKIKLVSLSPKVKTLILFMDEGFTQGRKFESSGRIFLIAFENNDLATMKFAQGPHFYHEKAGQREQYWTRDYMVNIVDMNNDGVKEIAVQYNHIQRILIYKGFGEWSRF